MSAWHALRSLRHRNYRLYYLGQLVSMHGTWMQNVAQAWLVYRLTGSSLMLGLVSFFGLLPMLLFGLVGGVVADRCSRRRLLLGAQLLAMVQALLLAALTLSGAVAVWHIIGLAMLLGLVQAFEVPARHSFVAEVVPKEDLANAIALNSSLFNVARFLGPALAGWLVALFGEGLVFLVNGLSFLAVLVGLLRIRLPKAVRPVSRGSLGGHFREGLGFAWRHGPIRAALMMVATVSVAGTSYVVLMPVLAGEVFAGGATTLGLLLSAAGAGALAGALRLAYRAGTLGLERVIGAAGLLAGAALLLLSTVQALWLAVPVLAVIGFSLTTLVAAANTLIQMLVPDALRGRVMALFSVIFLGLSPIGHLLAGTAGHVLGVSPAIGLYGAICLLGGGAFLRFAPKGDGTGTAAVAATARKSDQ